MPLDLYLKIITIGLAVISILTAPLVYIWTKLVQRVDKLEHEVEKKVSKVEMQVMLDTKLESLKEDMVETKALLSKLLDLELRRHDK